MKFVLNNPYLRLLRLDKPVGALLLYIPCLWGIALCSTSENTLSIILWGMVFLWGAFWMRSAGCVLNDILDRDIDRYVRRTQNRPLATGELTVCQAWGAFFLCLLGGVVLCLYLSSLAKIISLGALVLLCIYPLMKRFFPFPQFVLGLAFNSGVIIAVAHINPELLYTPKPYLLYTAGIFWTLYYDTIYALQDAADDVLIGVKSTAVYFKEHIKLALGVFYCLFSGCILILGVYFNADYWYYLAIIMGVAVDLGYELRRLDLNNPQHAAHLFRQSVIIGIAVVFLILWP